MSSSSALKTVGSSSAFQRVENVWSHMWWKTLVTILLMHCGALFSRHTLMKARDQLVQSAHREYIISVDGVATKGLQRR